MKPLLATGLLLAALLVALVAAMPVQAYRLVLEQNTTDAARIERILDLVPPEYLSDVRLIVVHNYNLDNSPYCGFAWYSYGRIELYACAWNGEDENLQGVLLHEIGHIHDFFTHENIQTFGGDGEAYADHYMRAMMFRILERQQCREETLSCTERLPPWAGGGAL